MAKKLKSPFDIFKASKPRKSLKRRAEERASSRAALTFGSQVGGKPWGGAGDKIGTRTELVRIPHKTNQKKAKSQVLDKEERRHRKIAKRATRRATSKKFTEAGWKRV